LPENRIPEFLKMIKIDRTSIDLLKFLLESNELIKRSLKALAIKFYDKIKITVFKKLSVVADPKRYSSFTLNFLQSCWSCSVLRSAFVTIIVD